MESKKAKLENRIQLLEGRDPVNDIKAIIK